MSGLDDAIHECSKEEVAPAKDTRWADKYRGILEEGGALLGGSRTGKTIPPRATGLTSRVILSTARDEEEEMDNSPDTIPHPEPVKEWARALKLDLYPHRNFHATESLLLQGRRKVFPIPHHTLPLLLSGGIAIHVGNLPPDAIVVSVHYDHCTACFDVQVVHPSFEPVPDMCRPEPLRDREMTVYSVREVHSENESLKAQVAHLVERLSKYEEVT